MSEMNPNVLRIVFADSVEDAPRYTSEVIQLALDQVVVIAEGTEEGRPTVDLQFTDTEGNQYLTMLTGAIVMMLGDAIKAKHGRE